MGRKPAISERAFSESGNRFGLIAPGQQLIDAALRVPGDDAADDAGDVGLRVDVVELGGLDERGEDRPVLGTAVGPGEEAVLAAEARGRMERSTMLLSSSMRPSSRKRVRPPAGQGVEDRLGELGLLADGLEFAREAGSSA